MLSRVHIGKTFYEIIGGKEPEIIEFTVDSYIVNADGSVTFPNKHIGMCTYSEYTLGLTVFEDKASANIKAEQIRSVLNG